jgi:hypothetical protein
LRAEGLRHGGKSGPMNQCQTKLLMLFKLQMNLLLHTRLLSKKEKTKINKADKEGVFFEG